MISKIDKEGIWFKYIGDEVCLMWFWNKKPNRYYSRKLACTFFSIKEYGRYMGSATGVKERKVLGLSYRDVLEGWVNMNFGNEYVIALIDVDISKKNNLFWENIPYIKREAFSKDVVILRCKDLSQQQRIMDSLDPGFATAYAFKAGLLIRSNDDNQRD